MSLTHPSTPLTPTPRSFATSGTPTTAARQRLRIFQRHLALWTLQGWLAMFFSGAALAKLTSSHELLIHLLGWPEHAGLALLQAVGALELALAIGVLTPLLSWRLAPVMSASATGLFGLAAFNIALHLSRLEIAFAALNLVLAAAALALLIGRSRWSSDRA